MKRVRFTDLEKFCLEQLFRPYQNRLGYEKRLEKLPVKLDEVIEVAKENPKWWNMVLNRISKYKLYFPKYIQHPLVDFINEGLAEREGGEVDG